MSSSSLQNQLARYMPPPRRPPAPVTLPALHHLTNNPVQYRPAVNPYPQYGKVSRKYYNNEHMGTTAKGGKRRTTRSKRRKHRNRTRRMRRN